MPRFALPNEEPIDPFDVAATAPRPALTARSARARLATPPRTIRADGTEEVAVEDILLEAYAEEPPPRPSRSVAPPAVPPQVTIAAAIAAVVPPRPAESAAVDALLRASDPAFAPFTHPAHAEPASIAPFAVTMAPPSVLPRHEVAARPARKAAASRAWLVFGALALLLLGVAAGVALVLAIASGKLDGLVSSAKSFASRVTEREPQSAVVAAAPTPAAPPVAPEAPAPAPPVTAEPVLTTTTPSALPSRPAIAPDLTLVTFPPSARGHRVFVDGRRFPVGASPTAKMKCGHHTIKIGTAGAARAHDLPCGGELTLVP